MFHLKSVHFCWQTLKNFRTFLIVFSLHLFIKFSNTNSPEFHFRILELFDQVINVFMYYRILFLLDKHTKIAWWDVFIFTCICTSHYYLMQICCMYMYVGEANGTPVILPENLWTEEPGSLQSIEWQRVRHDWSDLAHMKLYHVYLCVGFYLYTHHASWCVCVSWNKREVPIRGWRAWVTSSYLFLSRYRPSSPLMHCHHTGYFSISVENIFTSLFFP